MNEVAYIIDKDEESVTVWIGVNPYSISSSHMNYDLVLKRLKEKNYDDLEKLLDVPASVAKASDGRVVVENEALFYNGEKISNVLVDRILEFIKKNLPFEPLVAFLENLLENPNNSAIKELYLFLESGKLPITEDGCFLAYKKVDDNLNSYHACPDGTYLNHEIGATIVMPREDVDTDRYRTCSSGLHFCSLSYLSHYSGGKGRVVILKINPKDVCAIPSDYKNTKGRAACYQVVAEYDYKDKENVEAFSDPLVDSSNVEESMTHVKEEQAKKAKECESCPDGCDVCTCKKNFHNLRGSDGRFIKAKMAKAFNDTENAKPTKKAPKRGPNGRFVKG